jgi:hypothetical protein
MKRLYIERFYLNRADDEYPMTVRIILQMRDDVDGHLQGLTYEIPDRHPLQIAPIADYRNAKQK